MQKKIFLALAFLACSLLHGQPQNQIISHLLGNWEGAFIKNNSYQKIEIEFSEKAGKVYALQIMDEWHPTFGEFEVPVEIDSTGKISFSTGYGKTELVLDQNNLEMIGQVKGTNPAIYLHFKKVPKKPAPNYKVEAITIASGPVKLAGHLHIPNQLNKRTAIILVGGRGCYADQTKYNLYAKFLRKYGITVLAYQKRGTGQSTGDCSSATIEDLAEDLQQAKKYLESHPNNYEKIGVLGISAGGWTMAKAEERTDFDFMISIVGPSTSVKDQQLQSMEYGAAFYQLSPDAKQNLRKYTNLMFDAAETDAGFAEMEKLLAGAEKEQWQELLEDTDIPANAKEIANLWVRRHNFDPLRVLGQYDKPFLAIYGERDWIVPHQENVQLLEKYFATKKANLNTVVAHNAEHGMEMEARWIDLWANQSYWHFYRISPEVSIEIVDFLKKYDLTD